MGFTNTELRTIIDLEKLVVGLNDKITFQQIRTSIFNKTGKAIFIGTVGNGHILCADIASKKLVGKF